MLNDNTVYENNPMITNVSSVDTIYSNNLNSSCGDSTNLFTISYSSYDDLFISKLNLNNDFNFYPKTNCVKSHGAPSIETNSIDSVDTIDLHYLSSCNNQTDNPDNPDNSDNPDKINKDKKSNSILKLFCCCC